MKKLLKFLAYAVGLLILLSAGLVAWLFHQGHQAPKMGSEYVAMGSSFAAGPGLGDVEPGSPTLCARSTKNYAHLLAQARGLTLTDMSCGGATTAHVLRGGQFFQGPQIDAIGPDTKLVTVTIGGNDIAYIGGLASWACKTAPERVFWLWRPLVCMSLKVGAEDDLKKTREALIEIGKLVHERAPKAQLVFVDYVTVLPATGTCPERIPLSEAQMAEGRSIAAALGRITAEAAEASQSLVVKASEVTAAHDICAADSWIVPWKISANPFGTAFLHPTAPSMHAVADAINTQLQ